MKRLKPLSVLILILLASLPNAAKSEPVKPSPESANTPKAESPQVTKQTEHSQGPQSTASPSPSVAIDTQTPNLNHDKDSDDANARREATYTGFLVLVGVAAIVISVFNYCASKSAAKAAAISANISRAQLAFARVANQQNVQIGHNMVEVAQLGLKADRPYLLVQAASLTGVVDKVGKSNRPATGGLFDALVSMYLEQERLKDTPVFFPEAVFVFKNFGKGPALIENLIASVDVVYKLPEPRDFSMCLKKEVHPEAIDPGGDLSVKHISTIRVFSMTTWRDDIANERAKLIVYGLLSYRDVYKNLYDTGFCWIFTPPKSFPLDLLKGTPKDVADVGVGPMMPSSFDRGPNSHNFST